MTSTVMQSSIKSKLGIAFWTDLWKVTLCYMAWAYGVLALSLIGFGLYASLRWIVKH